MKYLVDVLSMSWNFYYPLFHVSQSFVIELTLISPVNFNSPFLLDI